MLLSIIYALLIPYPCIMVACECISYYICYLLSLLLNINKENRILFNISFKIFFWDYVVV